MAITAADKAQQEKVTEDEILASLVILFDPPTDSICEFGDVTLIVDDALHPTLRMKVSSCILATSSKVFRALFSNKLSEDRSKEILLREPPRAMRMLCGLLHLQPLDEAPESLELLELAVLADKYDCTSSLGYAFKCILGDAKNSTSYSRLDHLVTAAYMVGQPKHFRDITKELVLHSVLRPDQVDERCLELLPPNLLGETSSSTRIRDRHADTEQLLWPHSRLSLATSLPCRSPASSTLSATPARVPALAMNSCFRSRPGDFGR